MALVCLHPAAIAGLIVHFWGRELIDVVALLNIATARAPTHRASCQGELPGRVVLGPDTRQVATR